MKYERLTEQGQDGKTYIRIFDGTIGGALSLPLAGNKAARVAIDRLAELEDKIESGKMIDCPYGDKVWVIDYDEDIVSYVCVGSNKDFLFLSPTVYVGKDITTAKELCNYYVDCYIEDGDDADIVVFPRNKCFTDKSKAEARLKELQGEG